MLFYDWPPLLATGHSPPSCFSTFPAALQQKIPYELMTLHMIFDLKYVITANNAINKMCEGGLKSSGKQAWDVVHITLAHVFLHFFIIHGRIYSLLRLVYSRIKTQTLT